MEKQKIKNQIIKKIKNKNNKVKNYFFIKLIIKHIF